MTFYENLSQIYDAVMDQELYNDWLAFTLRHLSADTHKILELACGSGILTQKLSAAGFELTGLDISDEMLRQAAARTPSAEFIAGDMRQLVASGLSAKSFDAVTCYSDSLCYLTDLSELTATFDGVRELLNPGGTFIFDVHSVHQVDDIFPGYSYHENAEDFGFMWDSYPGDARHSVVHELTFFVKGEDGRFTRADEVHEERTYELTDYLTALDKFGKVEVYADFTDDAPDEDSKRWFFVCEK